MRVVAMMALVVAACGGGAGSGGGGGKEAAKPERAPLDPAAKPVQIELAWVVTQAPTEVKETECTLVLRVIRPGVPKDEMHQMGAWWREQKVLGKDDDTPWRQIERVEVPVTTPVEARAPEPPP